MQYEYAAKSSDGAMHRGSLAAVSVKDVHQQLREKGLFVLSAQPLGRGLAMLDSSRRRMRRQHVSKHDLMTFTSQLAIMSRSGVDLATALGNLATRAQLPALRKVLGDIHAEVIAGKPVSEALSNHESVFGKTYIAGIAAAEASGRLPEVLNRLSSLLRGDLRLQRTLRGMLAYPIVLALVAIVVVFGLIFFVLPQFAGVFEQMNLTLPAITQTLLFVGTELRARWWLWGALLAGMSIAAAMAVLRPAGKAWFHRMLLEFPVVRDVTRSLWIGRTMRLLSTMLASGVPLLDSLRLTRASVRNVVLDGFFHNLEREVINGRGLAPTFLASNYVPPAAAQMIATAEQTGTLATVMELVGEFYEDEGESKLRELSTILEPVIIIVMGIVVAVIVMSVMLPIFDFATAAK
jgi:type II secretory pathway component PulF